MQPALSRGYSVELQRDALGMLLIGSFFGWMLLLMGALFHASVTYTPWPVVPFSVLLGAIVGADELYRRWRTRAAAWLLVLGLFAAPGLYLALYGPGQPLFVFMVIPIIAASVLIGNRAEFLVAGIAGLWSVGTTVVWYRADGVQAIGSTWSLTWAPLCVYLLVAIIAHIKERNVALTAAWAIDSAARDALRAKQFHAQADQLAQALHSLERTNVQLRIVNAELDEARAAAEAANQLKTRFLANVSHELRTPLTIILGHSQLAFQVPPHYGVELPVRLMEDARSVHQNAAHLLRLINDLLDVARTEIDVLELRPEPIETRTFLEQVFADLAKSVPHRPQVAWKLDLPPYLPELRADTDRLRQVLLNLLNNAATGTERGQIVLGAELDLPHVHIWVADTGTGMPNDLRQRIFEPFVTGERISGRPGIGLGLSIARRLVELHSGTLMCESQEGQGSTFHIRLPLQSFSAQPAVRVKGATPVLLLLSARDAVPDAVIALGERQGLPIYRVDAAGDLASVLAEVQPVGVVCDMPGIDVEHWPIVQHIRAHPQLCCLPLITYSHEPSAPAKLAAGLVSVVVKPVGGSALVKTAYALSEGAAQGPILIVDDDPEVRTFYRRLLADAFPSAPLLVAEHGAAALALVADVTPQLIVLDLMMPEMDGFTLLDHLRANGPTRRTPVLVLSGHVLSMADIERLNHHAVTVVSKRVFTPDELASRLTVLLTEGEALSQSTSLLVKRALVYIHQHYREPIGREAIADALHISVRYLTRIFSAEMGLPLQEYLARYRVSQARLLLETSAAPVAQIALQVGFEDPNYFSRAFRKQVGVSPQAYRTSCTSAPASLPGTL